MMTEALVWEDYLTVALYFVVVLAVGLWVSSFALLALNPRTYPALMHILNICMLAGTKHTKRFDIS